MLERPKRTSLETPLLQGLSNERVDVALLRTRVT